MSKQGYLITGGEIAAMAGLHKTHFLNPKAARVNKSLGDLTGLTGLGFHLIEVEPGFETTEHHMHHHEDECVYILSGEGSAVVGDDTFPVKAGDFLGYRKGGLAHSIRNTGTSPLLCLVAGERLAHDVGDYPRLGKRVYRNAGMAWNLVDCDDITEPSAGRKL
jgi:uncharacterized cupin superfamily protein